MLKRDTIKSFLSLPANLKYFSFFLPSFIEKRIDEEGKDTGQDWLSIKMSGSAWAKLCLTIGSAAGCESEQCGGSVLNLRKLGMLFGITMKGTLLFPAPIVRTEKTESLSKSTRSLFSFMSSCFWYILSVFF